MVIMKEIMSWLFEDPIVTMAWISFIHAQSNSKKWSNSQMPQMINLPQMNFFYRKTTNKIFVYLLSRFILQNFKKFVEPIQSYGDVPFSDPKWKICPEQIFFGTNHYFDPPIGPFHCAKFIKNPYNTSRVMGQTSPFDAHNHTCTCQHTRHFCLYLFGTLKWRKLKEQKHQIEWLIIFL